MALVSSPVSRFGGKARLAARIVSLFPPHKTYCEPFGGSAAVLLAKAPAAVETYNDLDGDLVHLFRVIRDPRKFRALKNALENTPYAREEFALAHEWSREPVERARRFMIRCRQSHAGLGNNWSYCTTDARGGVSSAVQRWRSALAGLDAVRDRMARVQIECIDFRDCLARYDAVGALFYLDPPYIADTRTGTGERCGYLHELTDNDHRDLVAALRGLKGMAVLSGYDHPIYAPLDADGWQRAEFDVPAYTSAARSRRTERLWLSPNCVTHAHGLF